MTLQTEILKMLDAYNSYAFRNYIITRHVVIELVNGLPWFDDPKQFDAARDLITKLTDTNNNILGIISTKKMPRYVRYTDLERDSFIVGKTKDYDFRRLLKHLTIQGMLKAHNQYFLYTTGLDDQGNELKIYFK